MLCEFRGGDTGAQEAGRQKALLEKPQRGQGAGRVISEGMCSSGRRKAKSEHCSVLQRVLHSHVARR